MVKGVINRQFEQTGYPPIKISILPTTQIVKLEQGDSQIFIRFPYMEEFVYEMNEVRRWTKPKKDETKW